MKYHAQQCVSLIEGATFVRPPSLPRVIRLDDAALDVMTDFNQVPPLTVRPDTAIDSALETMKVAGVRLLLVVDAADQILGLITSYDVQGERPIELASETRVARSEIRVTMVMTPRAAIDVLPIGTVRRIKVGHVVETLRHFERQHLLVVDAEQRVCGLFSMSQIRKQLAGHAGSIPLSEHTATLAELAHGHHFGS